MAHGDELGYQAGQRIILPGSYKGTPRAMYKNYSNAMSGVMKHGKPGTIIKILILNLKHY